MTSTERSDPPPAAGEAATLRGCLGVNGGAVWIRESIDGSTGA